MIYNINSRPYTRSPTLATSSVAPAPCSARARPCLDVWWGEPSLVQHPLCWPARPGSNGRCRAREITVWYCEATSGFGVRGVWLGTGPRRGPSRLGYPGSPGGRPASRLFLPFLSILCMYTLPTTIVFSSATLPLPLPSSTWFFRAVLFSFPVACVVFLRFLG